MALLRVEVEDWANITSEIDAATSNVGDARFNVDGRSFEEVFCEWWPTAKKVLETLADLLPKIGWVIKIVISVADKLHEKIC